MLNFKVESHVFYDVHNGCARQGTLSYVTMETKLTCVEQLLLLVVQQGAGRTTVHGEGVCLDSMA